MILTGFKLITTLPEPKRLFSIGAKFMSLAIHNIVSGRDDPAIKIMASCFKNIQLAESQFPGLDSTQVSSFSLLSLHVCC